MVYLRVFSLIFDKDMNFGGNLYKKNNVSAKKFGRIK